MAIGVVIPNCVFLVVFLFLRQMDLVHTSPFIDCDKFKYKVHYPNVNQHYCMDCLICPQNAESKLHNPACKKKIPNSIPGQGYAWCTGNDKSPWCPQLTVQHGKLNCTKSNDVYSSCRLECDSGYMPENSSWEKPECLESLNWSIPDQSVLRCQRSAKPDKPKVTSIGQRQEVRAGSEKTLLCSSTSITVGKRKTYWYFNGKKLFHDSNSTIYVIHGASKHNEGDYFCQVEDDIGESELSASYYLKVEETYTMQAEKSKVTSIEQKPELSVDYYQKVRETHPSYQIHVELISGILLVAFSLTILGILYWKRSKMHTCSLAIWHSITKCQHHEEKETVNSCLSSVASSVGGSSQTSGTTETTDSGSSDVESKQPLIPEEGEMTLLSQLIDEIDKPKVLESKSLLTEKEISNREKTVGIQHLTSAVKEPALKDSVKDQALTHPQMNEIVHKSCTRNDKTIEIGYKNITGTNNQDQHGLRLVFRDYKLMKRIVTLLDQKPEVNHDKPTFQNLGRYLGDSPDEVLHFEFRCQQKNLSPTEVYIKRMTEEGLGLSHLLTFLKQHEQTLGLAEEIEKTVLHLYHPLVG